MRLKMTLMALFISTPFAIQAEQLKINGYFNGIYSQADADAADIETKDDGSFTKNSNAGIKTTFIKNNNISGTAQLEFAENAEGDFEATFNEGYLRYTFNQSRFIKAGKFLTPQHIDSNIHNYQQFKSWLINPKTVYSITSPLSTTGVNFTQKNKTNIYEISTELFFGQGKSRELKTKLNTTRNTEIKYSGLWGASSKLVGKSHTINFNYINAKSQLHSNELESSGPTLTQNQSTEKHNYQLTSIGAVYSITDNTILKSEIKSESFDGLLPDTKSYYANVSQYWSDYEMSLTFGESKHKETQKITEIKAGIGYLISPRAKVFGEFTRTEIKPNEQNAVNHIANEINLGLLVTF